MVLESVVSALLSKYLGDYVDGLSADNLSLGIFSGEVVLENLALKRSALAGLHLPVTVKAGYLGKLTLKIPWKSLGSQPTIITIDKLFLIAGSAEEEIKRALVTKQRRLQLAELIGTPGSKDEEQAPKAQQSDGFAKQMIEKIVQNIQLFVNKVHLRYEDSISSPGSTFSAGLTLELLHAQSANEKWEPTFLSVVTKIVNKNLAAYWDTDDKPLHYKDQADMGQLMESLIHQDGDGTPARRLHPPHSYLLKPINAQLRAVLNTNDAIDMKIPKITLILTMEELVGRLEERQFSSLQDLGLFFTNYIKSRPYIALRPSLPIATAPKQWWRFLHHAIFKQVREKREKWTWAYFKQRKANRLRYIHLWRLYKTKRISTEEKKELDQMEIDLAFDDIILYRSLADALLKGEKKKRDEAAKQQSWWSWATGGGPTIKDEKVADLTQEDWQRLYTAINFEEKPVQNLVEPPDYVKIHIQVMFKRIAVELMKADREMLVGGGITDVGVSVDIRPQDSLGVQLTVGAVQLLDLHTVPGQVTHILRPVDTAGAGAAQRPLLEGSVQVKPVTAQEDVIVLMEAHPVQVTFSRPLIDRVVKFFDKRSSVLDDLRGAMNDNLAALQESARTQLKYALEKRKVIGIKIKIAAPKVHVPASFTNPDAPVVVADLGEITLDADPAARHTQTKAISAAPGSDPRVSNDFFYDKFILTVSHVNVVLSRIPSGFNTRQDFTLVPRFNLNSELRICNTASKELPRIMISGQLSKVKACMITSDLSALLDILDNVLSTDAVAAPVAAEPAASASSLSASSLSASESEPVMFEGILLSPVATAPAKREVVREEKKVIQIAFGIEKLKVSLLHKTPTDTMPMQLASAKIAGLQSEFEMQTSKMRLSVSMGSLRVKDSSEKYKKDPKWRYLLSSGNTEGTDRFFAAVLESTPRDGTMFAGVEHQVRHSGKQGTPHFLQVQIKLATVSAVVTRETFVKLLDISRLMGDVFNKRPQKKKKSPGPAAAAPAPQLAPPTASPGNWTLARSSKAKAAKEAEQPKETSTQQSVEDFFVLARVRVELDRVEVRLNRNGTEILYAALEKIGASAEAFSDNTVMLAGELAAVVVRDSQKVGTPWSEIVQIKQNVPHSFSQVPLTKHPSQALLNWTSTSGSQLPNAPPTLAVTPAEGGDASLGLLRHTSSALLSGGAAPTKPVFEYGNLLPSCSGQLSLPPGAAPAEQPLVEWSLNTYKSRFDNDFGADASAGVLINSVRMVVVWRLICELLEYVKEFDEMNQMLVAAASAAAESTRRAAVNTPAKWVKVDVSILNPIVMIPRKNSPDEYIRFDLGQTFLSNTFREEEEGITETFTLGLVGFGWTVKEHLVQAESAIMHNFSTNVVLDKAHYKSFGKPPVTITANIADLSLSISENELDTMLRIMIDDLTEVPWPFKPAPKTEEAPRFPAPARPSEAPVVPASPQAASGRSLMPGTHRRGESSTHDPNDDIVRMEAKFDIGRFGIELRRKDPDNPDLVCIPLLGVAVDRIHTQVTMAVSELLVAIVSIHSVTVLDLRPKTDTKLRDVVTSSTQRTSEKESQVHLIWKQRKDGTKELLCQMLEPRVYLIADVLWLWKEVVLTSMLPRLNAALARYQAHVALASIEAALDLSNSVRAVPLGLNTPSPTFTINVTVRSCDVVYVETTQRVDSRAFIIRVSTLLEFVARDNEQAIKLKLSDLQMFKCRLTHEDSTRVSLLAPFTIDARVIRVGDASTSITVAFDGSTNIVLSYQDFKLYMAITNTWFTAMREIKVPTGSNVPKEGRAHVGLIDASQAVVIQAASPLTKSRRPEAAIAEEKKDVKEVLLLNTGTLDLTLINDCYGLGSDKSSYTTPVLHVNIPGFESRLANWSSALDGKANVSMGIDFYNEVPSAWEPLLERSIFEVVFSSSKDPPALIATLTSREDLNFNVSRDFLESMLSYMDTWRMDYYAKEQEDSALGTFHPYYIKNDTGEPNIIYAITVVDSGAEQLLQQPRLLERGKEHAIEAMEYEAQIREKMKEQMKQIPRMLHVQIIPETGPIFNLPTFPVGRAAYPLSQMLSVVKDIEALPSGSKLITFRSPIVIRNRTPVRLAVQVTPAAAPIEGMDPIESNGCSAVPVRYAHKAGLRFRATDFPSYDWSDQSLNTMALRSGVQVLACRFKADLTMPAWFYACHVEKRAISDSFTETILTLGAPMTIENVLASTILWRLQDAKNVITSGKLARGQSASVYQTEQDKEVYLSIKIENFEWSKRILVTNTNPDAELIIADPATKHTLHVRMANAVDSHGTRQISLYTACWMLNKTGLRILYKRTPDGTLLFGQEKIANDPKYAKACEGEPHTWYNFNDSELSQPYMFSHDSVSIKIANSPFSQLIPLTAQRQLGALSITDESKPSIAVDIKPAPGKYSRTKLVTFTSRYVLINRLPVALLYRQPDPATDRSTAGMLVGGGLPLKDQSLYWKVLPGEQIPFHWPSNKLPKQFCMRLDYPDAVWSKGISFASVGSFDVKMARRDGTHTLVRTEIQLEKANTLIDFTFNVELPAYRISNQTDKFWLHIRQDGHSGVEKVKPLSKVPYAWDDPTAERRRVVLRVVRDKSDQVVGETTLALDKIKEQHPLGVGEGLQVEVKAEGPTLTLEVTQLLDTLVPEEKSEGRKMIVQLRLAGFGLSIITRSPRIGPHELIYMRLQTIAIDYHTNDCEQSLELLVDRMQIDNGLYNTPYPIMLYPVLPPNMKVLQLALVHSKEWKTITFIRYFSFLLQQVDIRMEEVELLRLLNFVQLVLAILYQRTESDEEKKLLNSFKVDTFTRRESFDLAARYYFELLALNPIKANLSFQNLPALHDTALEDVKVQQLQNLFSGVGSLANIEMAPINLNALIMKHPFVTLPELTQRITKHYTQQIMGAMAAVLGSAEFLGSPVSLVSNIGTGVKDFFYEPAHGLVTSPKDFGEGIAKGTTSLFKKSVYGVFNTTSKVTGSIAKVAELATFDEKYQREKQVERATSRPAHAGEGALQGIKGFGMGIFKGVTGIVEKPIEGLKEEGGVGLVKGVGKGLAGVVVKPVVGTVELFSKTAEGVKNTTTYLEDRSRRRVRYPRHFHPDSPLEPYSPDQAFGQFLLKRIDKCVHVNEGYLFFARTDAATKRFLIVSTSFFILTRPLPEDPQHDSIESDWTEPAMRVVGLSKVDNASARVIGIQIDLGARTNVANSSLASLFSHDSQAEGNRVLKCDNDVTRDAIFNKLNTWLASHSINTYARLRQAPLGVALDFNAPLNDEQYHAVVSRRKAEAEAAAKKTQQLEAEKESKAMHQMRREWDEHRNRRQRMEEEARTQAAQEARRIREEQKAIRKKQREAAMRLAAERKARLEALVKQKETLRQRAAAVKVVAPPALPPLEHEQEKPEVPQPSVPQTPEKKPVAESVPQPTSAPSPAPALAPSTPVKPPAPAAPEVEAGWDLPISRAVPPPSLAPAAPPAESSARAIEPPAAASPAPPALAPVDAAAARDVAWDMPITPATPATPSTPTQLRQRRTESDLNVGKKEEREDQPLLPRAAPPAAAEEKSSSICPCTLV